MLIVGCNKTSETTEQLNNLLPNDLKNTNILLNIGYSKFKETDKIEELVDKLSVDSTETIRIPYENDSEFSWNNFFIKLKKYYKYIINPTFKEDDLIYENRTKFNHDIFSYNIFVYNLSRSFIKFRLYKGDSLYYQFGALKEVLDLINGGEVKDKHNDPIPSWRATNNFYGDNLTIIMYNSTGTCDISGELLEKLKPFIINKLRKSNNGCNIIITK